MQIFRRPVAFLVAAALLATSALPSMAAANWTTRGGDERRTSSVDDPFGWLGPRYAFAVDTGLSASQALAVDNVIYHMGGNEIWMIDPEVAARHPDNHNVWPPSAANPGVRLLRSGINTWKGSYRPSSSGLTYKKINGQHFLFFGTGSNEVCALNITGVHGDVTSNHSVPAPECLTLAGEEPITAVPLVFTTVVNGVEQDIVVISDKGGYVWAIQNLSGVAPGGKIWTRKFLGGWVTASPAATGNGLEFITAADGIGSPRGNGKVEKFTIVPHNPAKGITLDLIPQWGDRGIVQYGIADGITIDGGYAYLADTRGNLYRFEITSGNYDILYWNEVLPGTSGVFANQAAAVDSKHVYFTYRFVDTGAPGRRPDPQTAATHPGAVIAVDKITWKPVWVQKLDTSYYVSQDYPTFLQRKSAANTSPVVLEGSNVVMVGGMDGSIWTFRADNGHYAHFVTAMISPTNTCVPTSHFSLLTEPGMLPYKAEHSYQQLNGSGTEPSFMYTGSDAMGNPKGYLLVGANFQWDQGYVPPSGEKTGGRLLAFKTANTFNTKVISVRLLSEAELQTGNEQWSRWEKDVIKPWDFTDVDKVDLETGRYIVEVVIQVDGLQGDRDLPVMYYYVNKDGDGKPKTLGWMNLSIKDGLIEGRSNVATLRFPVDLSNPEFFGNGFIEAAVNVFDVITALEAEVYGTHPLFTDERFAAEVVVSITDHLYASARGAGVTPFDGCRADQYGEVYIETGYGSISADDNFAHVPIRVVGGNDLVLASATAPKAQKYTAGGSYNVTFTVENVTTKPLEADWRATLNGAVIASGTATWNPGTVGNIRTFSVPITGPNKVQEVVIEVNPSRTLEEIDYSNNSKTVKTSISPEAADPNFTPDPTIPGGPADIWRGGDDEGVLVPRDCSVNDDPTDRRPCNNYGYIVSPWYCANNPGAPECRGYTPGGVWYNIP